MAIVIGNKTGSQLNPSGSTQTLSHNMSTGSDGALLICVTANNSGGKQIGSCSYGGQVMSTSSTLNANTFAQQQKYFILNNPPTGSNNIVVTYSGGSQWLILLMVLAIYLFNLITTLIKELVVLSYYLLVQEQDS